MLEKAQGAFDPLKESCGSGVAMALHDNAVDPAENSTWIFGVMTKIVRNSLLALRLWVVISCLIDGGSCKTIRPIAFGPFRRSLAFDANPLL
jgi:hypothetical protein